MEISQILGFLSGYFNALTFELDIPKIADVSEMSEEEVEQELNKLNEKGDIRINGNTVTLCYIKPEKNKQFNELYAPVETMNWDKGMKLKLDK